MPRLTTHSIGLQGSKRAIDTYKPHKWYKVPQAKIKSLISEHDFVATIYNIVHQKKEPRQKMALFYLQIIHLQVNSCYVFICVCIAY